MRRFSAFWPAESGSGRAGKRFLQIAEASKQAALAREFIARLRELDRSGSGSIEGRSTGEWFDWAESNANERDPVGQGLKAIFSDVAKVEAWTRFD